MKQTTRIDGELEELAEEIAAQEIAAQAENQRLSLDAGNYAIFDGGMIKLYLKGDRELCSVDSSMIAFEKKVLTTVMQVYLLGFGHGRAQEKNTLNEKLAQALHLIFD